MEWMRQLLEYHQEVKDPKMLDKKPQRVYVKRAPKSGDLATVLQALGAKRDSLEDTAILNGLQLADSIEKGYWLKVVGD